MRYFSLFFPFAFFLLFSNIFYGATATNIIHKTCKKSAKSDRNIHYAFCVTSLQAVPESHCANRQELGLISMELTLSNATHTRSYIKKLLKNRHMDPYIRGCLIDCFDLYSDAIPTLKKAIKDFNSKHYFDANIEVSAVMDASTTCEEGFKEKKGAVSPLTKQNNNLFQLSAIALSIINMLH